MRRPSLTTSRSPSPTKRVVLASLTAALTACGTAKLKGNDCPSENQLAVGATITCGGRQISGKYLHDSLPSCSSEVLTNCTVPSDYVSVDATKLVPENIRESVTTGGVVGTLRTVVIGGDIPLCADDGSTDCIVANGLVAVDTTELASKIAMDQVAGGVTGSGVLLPARNCVGNAEIGCTTSTAYPASDQETLARCLPD